MNADEVLRTLKQNAEVKNLDTEAMANTLYRTMAGHFKSTGVEGAVVDSSEIMEAVGYFNYKVMIGLVNALVNSNDGRPDEEIIFEVSKMMDNIYKSFVITFDQISEVAAILVSRHMTSKED